MGRIIRRKQQEPHMKEQEMEIMSTDSLRESRRSQRQEAGIVRQEHQFDRKPKIKKKTR